MASSNPAIKALYSASLLEAGNSKRKAYVISSLSEFVKIRPALEPSLLEALSMNNVQSGVLSGIWVGETLLKASLIIIRKVPSPCDASYKSLYAKDVFFGI
ncbi:hypothetical protein Tco_0402722, partial [Tanacetum coccineum]